MRRRSVDSSNIRYGFLLNDSSIYNAFTDNTSRQLFGQHKESRTAEETDKEKEAKDIYYARMDGAFVSRNAAPVGPSRTSQP